MAKKAAKQPTEETESVSQGSLELLLNEAAKLYGKAKSQNKILFQLSYKKNSWKFEVVNCWSLWMEKGLTSDFQAKTPEQAVQRFLDYCKKHNVDPAELSLPD